MTTFTTSTKVIAEDPIAHRFDDLRAHIDQSIERLKASHAWNDDDVRIESLHRVRNIIQSGLAFYAFRKAIFPTAVFWTGFFAAIPTPQAMEDHARELDVMNRFGILHGLFSAGESDIRAIVRALDPQACNGGKAEFASVASWLMARTRTAAGYADYVELWRLTRNTIHNNGIHRPPNAKDASISWNGVTYEFIVDQPIEFVGWPFVLEIAEEMSAMLTVIVEDPLIKALPKVSA